MDADELARACADLMWADDKAAQGLGIVIESVAAGRSRLSMRVGPTMVNGHRICHGGFIFTLADTAFAYGCNSRNDRAVAQHCTVTFVAPAREGAVLTAVCEERQRFGRSGVYDVTVSDDHGKAIAEFRGLSRTIKGTFLPPEAVDLA
jgi:acyl-CoA thioesterase